MPRPSGCSIGSSYDASDLKWKSWWQTLQRVIF